MRRRMLTLSVVLLLAGLWGCSGETGHWQAGVQFDHEITRADALYVTDPNAAVGLCLLYAETDTDTDDALGIGAVTRFALGPVVEAAFDLTLPGTVDLEKAPAQPWGTLGAGWNVDANQFWWMAGTGLEFLLTETVRPYVGAEIYSDLGVNESARVMTGVVVSFK